MRLQYLVMALSILGACGDEPASEPACLDGVQRDSVTISTETTLKKVGCRVIDVLNIENSELRNLQGIGPIEQINELVIANNPRLESLDGLDGVLRIGWLQIYDNPVLESVAALGSVDGSLFALSVEHNALTSLTGLHHISDVTTTFSLTEPHLTSLDGLEGLREVDTLRISGNAVLQSLDGLENVVLIGSRLFIQDNPLLTDVGALAGAHIDSGYGPFAECGSWVTGNACLTITTDDIPWESVCGDVIADNGQTCLPQ